MHRGKYMYIFASRLYDCFSILYSQSLDDIEKKIQTLMVYRSQHAHTCTDKLLPNAANTDRVYRFHHRPTNFHHRTKTRMENRNRPNQHIILVQIPFSFNVIECALSRIDLCLLIHLCMLVCLCVSANKKKELFVSTLQK